MSNSSVATIDSTNAAVAGAQAVAKLRICLVTEFFHPDDIGGTSAVMVALAKHFAVQPGVDVDVITSRHAYRDRDQDLPAYAEWEDIKVYRVAAPDYNKKGTALRSVGNLILTASSALKLLMGKKYDVVVVTTAPPFLVGAAHILRKLRGTQYLYIIYDLEPDRILALKLLDRTSAFVKVLAKNQKKWLADAFRVISIGRCMSALIESRYGTPSEKIDFLPVGSRDLSWSEGARQAFRAENKLDGFVALYSGNFGRYHNFTTILEGARRLQAVGEKVTFLLVGQGVQREAIAAEIAKGDLLDVRLMDYVDEDKYADLLSAADVCLVTLEAGIKGTCVPSKFYSLLAAGKPVIGLLKAIQRLALRSAKSTPVMWSIRVTSMDL